MVTYDFDNFIRANQTAWGTASDGNIWSQARGSMTWAITSNKGTCNSAAGATFNIFRLSSQSPTNQEIVVRVNPADTADIGIVGRYNSTSQFYYGVLTGGNTLAIGRDNSGFSTLASASFSYSAGTAYWLRFNITGTTLKLRGWADGSAEPQNTWNVTTTDATFASGGYGLGSDSTSGTNTQFDSFSVTDGSSRILVCDGLGGVFA